MKFKVDEHLPIEAAELLLQAGHDAITVLGQGLGGADDPAIAAICLQEDRAFITLDLDFADIRVYPPEQFPGLIVLRLKRQDKPYVLDALNRLIPMFSSESLERHLWIVEDERVRIRD